MIETDPDMPDPFAGKIEELAERRSLRNGQTLSRLLGTEDQAAGLAALLQAREPAVQGIEVEEQRVPGFKGCGLFRARGGKAQHRIGAVAVPVHLVLDPARRTGPAIG